MDGLPTFREIASFMKKNLKTIFITMLAIMFLYGVGVTYTTYTNSRVVELSEEIPVEGERAGELLLKNKNAVFMKVFIENNVDGVFTNFRLLNEVITNEEFIKDLEEYPAIKKLLRDDFKITDIINISFNSHNNTHNVTVSTGDLSANYSIIKELKEAVLASEFDILSDKQVYLISEPKKIETEEEQQAVTSNSTMSNFQRYFIIGAVGLVLSFVAGVAMAILRDFQKEEISDIYKVKLGLEEKVIDLGHISNQETVAKQIKHSIVHPHKSSKLILAEHTLFYEEHKSFFNEHPNLKVSSSILKTNPEENFDEILLVILRNKTSKEWIKSQKVQLTNYHSVIKIILV